MDAAPGQTAPMIFKAMRMIGTRSLLLGQNFIHHRAIPCLYSYILVHLCNTVGFILSVPIPQDLWEPHLLPAHAGQPN